MSILFMRRRKLGAGSIRGVTAFLNQENQDNAERLPIRAYEGRVASYTLHENLRNAPEADYLVRWGCTAETDRRFPLERQLNPSRAIHLVGNKKEFRRVLQRQHPDIIPATYFNANEVPADGRFIVRPAHHAQGRQLWVGEGRRGVQEIIRRHGLDDYYVSAFIDKEREFRVYVFEGRVVAVAEKTPGNPNQVAWNVAQGGRFDNVRWDAWPLRACEISILAWRESGLDFGGVDVMTRGNDAWIIEINSAPSLPLNENGSVSYRQECMGKAFKYILDHGKGHVPAPVLPARGWRDVIHPAIWTRGQRER